MIENSPEQFPYYVRKSVIFAKKLSNHATSTYNLLCRLLQYFLVIVLLLAFPRNTFELFVKKLKISLANHMFMLWIICIDLEQIIQPQNLLIRS